MEQTWIYCCEDSIEGIFTAVYDAWASKHGHTNIRIEINGLVNGCSTFQLFAKYIQVDSDFDKTEKVARSIKSKISNHAYEMVVRAVLSDCEDKGDAIYHFLVRGFAIGDKVTDYLSDSYVSRIFQMNRNVGNEVHFYLGFLRFHELVNGVMLAKFEPKNDIAGIVTPHFVDRFADENFIILDVKRAHAAIYSAGKQWVLMKLEEEQIEQLDMLSGEEETIKQLWKSFFETIAIDERKNNKLQRNNVPLHYRKYMIEFSK